MRLALQAGVVVDSLYLVVDRLPQPVLDLEDMTLSLMKAGMVGTVASEMAGEMVVMQALPEVTQLNWVVVVVVLAMVVRPAVLVVARRFSSSMISPGC
jgi:hypothetical protein